MEVFEMVVLIVAISCGAGVINNYLKNQRVAQERGPDEAATAEIEALKRRVAALETIVTDERYHLEQELDRLERQA